MPEIKHNFTGGKMNKDLNKRLVPKGEYRDAVNIQVSTSDGSDVGTIQNILGNTEIPAYMAQITNTALTFPGYGSAASSPPTEYDPYSMNFKTIGAIADEKNDKLYYFLRNSTESTPPFSIIFGDSLNQGVASNPSGTDQWYPPNSDYRLKSSGIQMYSDLIIEHDTVTETSTTVFTDNHTLVFDIYNADGGFQRNFGPLGSGAPTGFPSHGLDIDNNGRVVHIAIAMDEYLAKKFLIVGTSVECWSATSASGYGSVDVSNGSIIKSVTKIKTDVTSYLGSTKVGKYILDVSQPSGVGDGKGFDLKDANQFPEYLIFKLADSALGFTDDYLTGIDIIDDLMFFTSGKSEPKKINIERCKVGTKFARNLAIASTLSNVQNIYYGNAASRQTALIVNNELSIDVNLNFGGGVVNPNTSEVGKYYQEMSAQHTNVIKRKPTTRLKVKTNSSLRDGRIYGETVGTYKFSTNTNVMFQPGFVGELNAQASGGGSLNYKIGDVLLLLNEADAENSLRSLPFNYDVKLMVTSFSVTSIGFEILSISDDTPSGSVSYLVALQQFDDSKYSDEMMRFSYRYKYEDREVSAFAPFTDLVFLPGEFKYDNRNVFNAGMQNHLNSISLQDFIDPTTTSDVVSVDLLMKYESSPNIYVLDTIERSSWGSSTNAQYSTGNIFIPNTTAWEQGAELIQQPDLANIDEWNVSDGTTNDFSPNSFSVIDNFVGWDGGLLSWQAGVDVHFKKPGALVIGRTYEVTVTVGYFTPGASLRVHYGDGLDIAFPSASGTHSVTFTTQIESLLIAKNPLNAAGEIQIKHISCKEVDPNAGHLSSGCSIDLLGNYDFDLNSLKFALPSNQLLRAWDNVPTSALAQSVVGNRIVYGNYTQSYDYSLKEHKFSLIPAIGSRVTYLPQEFSGAPSVKSQRNYQVGMTWVDKEGRESPIVTDEKSMIYVSKTNSTTNNLISVRHLTTRAPEWASGYKYYIKDPLLPNYNFVIDTLYKAETGDYWLSVPSSERNKVEEGDYLEIKKGINSDKGVEEESTAKIISIKNEAPNFIKTRYRTLGKARHQNDYSGTVVDLIDTDDGPGVGKDHFKIFKNAWENEDDGLYGAGSALTNDDGLQAIKELAVQFKADIAGAVTSNLTGAHKSQMYLASSITKTGTAPGETYTIRLEEPISENDSWIRNSTGLIQATLILEVFERKIENMPEHEGRFFAKIQGKDDILDNITNKEYTWEMERILHNFPIRNFTDKYGEPTNGGNMTTNTSVNGPVNNIVSNQTDGITGGYSGVTHSYDEFEKLFEYDNVGAGNVIPNYWFIDRINFVGVQNQASAPAIDMEGWGMTGKGVFSWDDADNFAANKTPMYWDSFKNGKQGMFFMEISNSGMFGPMEIQSCTKGDQGSWSPHYIGRKTTGGSNIFSVHNIATNDEQTKAFTPDSKFRFDGHSEVFTIKAVDTEWRYNYSDNQEAVSYCQDAAAEPGGPTNAQQGLCDDATARFTHPLNRRLTYILALDKDPRDPSYGIDPMDSSSVNTQTSINLVFIDNEVFNNDNLLKTTNPAVFEVKNEDPVPVDIYYEASQEIPILLNGNEGQSVIEIGSEPYCPAQPNLFPAGTRVTCVDGDAIELNTSISNLNYIEDNNIQIYFPNSSGGFYATKIEDATIGTPANGYSSNILTVGVNTLRGTSIGLGWYNCIAFRNGVESAFLRDDFNKLSISKGVNASSTIEKPIRKEHKKSGLIYSGIYNTNSNINSLNEFIAAEKITKDLNPTYGSIQKLHTRDTDLIALCEDKVLRILANKDAVYNADGNSQLTATNNVLGQTIPFVGEFGISKNPESFASESYRAYFTDKTRGAVIRLSKDGLTAISDHGMKDWFRDNLKLVENLIGSYDDKKDEYNITLRKDGSDAPIPLGKSSTVTFREDVKGWVSFKSFIPEYGISCANNYFTFKNGNLWKHHVEPATPLYVPLNYNTFYNIPANSSFEVILNEAPGSIKSFKTLNYEGSQSKTDANTQDKEYYNLQGKDGWHVYNIETDQDNGKLNEFIEKENKWFNYIKGKSDTHNQRGIDSSNFAHQGLGRLESDPVESASQGCIDDGNCTVETCGYDSPNPGVAAFNYDDTATFQPFADSCVPVVHGCMVNGAENYNPNANTATVACIHHGCTDSTMPNGCGGGCDGALNYDPIATVDPLVDADHPHGSCIFCVFGCRDNTMWNYNPLATCDGGDGNTEDCMPYTQGCTDNFNLNVLNWNQTSNVDDGSCQYAGCTDPNAANAMIPYVSGVDPRSQDGLGNSNICYSNHPDYGSIFPFALTMIEPFPGPTISTLNDFVNDGGGTLPFIPPCPNVDDGSCQYLGCSEPTAINYDENALPDSGDCLYCGDVLALNYDGAPSFGPPGFNEAGLPDVGFPDGVPTSTAECIYCPTLEVTLSTTLVGAAGGGQSYITVTWQHPDGSEDFPVFDPSALPVLDSPGRIDRIDIHIAPTQDLPPFDVTGQSSGSFHYYPQNYNDGLFTNGITDNGDGTLSITFGESGWVGAILMGSPGIITDLNYSVAIDVYCVQQQQGFNDSGSTILQAGVNNITSNDQGLWSNITTPAPPVAAVLGCTDPTAFNYDDTADTDDGSCVPYVYGCIDSTAFNYDASANTDDGSCTYQGCTTSGGCGYADVYTIPCCIACDGTDDNYCCACGDNSGLVLNYGGVASGCTDNCIYADEIPAANVSVSFEAGMLAAPTTMTGPYMHMGVSTNFTITIPSTSTGVQYLDHIYILLTDTVTGKEGKVWLDSTEIPSGLAAGDTFTVMAASTSYYQWQSPGTSLHPDFLGVAPNRNYTLEVFAVYNYVFGGPSTSLAVTSTDTPITFSTNI